MTTTTIIKHHDGSTDTYTDLDTGSTDFGFVDQKGRKCGYAWNVKQIVSDKPQTRWGRDTGPVILALAGEPVIEVTSNPTRNGICYGPAFNRAICHSLEEARRLVMKRSEASRKRDHKKFSTAK